MKPVVSKRVFLDAIVSIASALLLTAMQFGTIIRMLQPSKYLNDGVVVYPCLFMFIHVHVPFAERCQYLEQLA